MSTTCGEEIFSIGERLRGERDRLSLSQADLGEIMGVDRKVVRHYEENKTSPRADQLVAFMRHGADLWFVLTGKRLPLSACEPEAAYLPRDKVALRVSRLNLSEADAEMLIALAERLARLP